MRIVKCQTKTKALYYKDKREKQVVIEKEEKDTNGTNKIKKRS